MLKAQQILAYLAIRYEGDWTAIYESIRTKKPICESDVLETVGKLKSPYVTLLDPDYPPSLAQIHRPPFVLFYHGDLSLTSDYQKCLAVVGSRNASEYATRKTEEIVGSVTENYIIVSGMARGIDSTAHRAAISHGGKTIAVLGNGIDYCYPSINKDIYDEMKRNHLILSEYPGERRPTPDSFPFRNRIIVGLSKGVFVPDCRRKSGTLVSVYHAISNNREVLCLPHPAGDDSECNRLIRDGAVLVETAEDVIAGMK